MHLNELVSLVVDVLSACFKTSTACQRIVRISLGVLSLTLTLLMLAMPMPAVAWSTEGHQVVALIAQAQMSPQAVKEVDKLLEVEPGSTLVSVSTWADENRSPKTAPWHYINFPRDTCNYLASRDCPGGNCVVEAIERQAEILRSEASDERRLHALKYVVHLVADVHQPLHAGYAEDRGGNSYQLRVLLRGTNLHALWDKWLIESLSQQPEALARKLLQKPLKIDGQLGWSMAETAAEESCQIVGMAGFYPERSVTSEYMKRYAPVAEQRLALAGFRLAELLNRIFSTR